MNPLQVSQLESSQRFSHSQICSEAFLKVLPVIKAMLQNCLCRCLRSTAFCLASIPSLMSAIPIFLRLILYHQSLNCLYLSKPWLFSYNPFSDCIQLHLYTSFTLHFDLHFCSTFISSLFPNITKGSQALIHFR